jgi:hypothetical protein
MGSPIHRKQCRSSLNSNKQPVRSAYQPPASSTFLSERTSHQQPVATRQQYSSLRTNQHQPSATSQPNRLKICGSRVGTQAGAGSRRGRNCRRRRLYFISTHLGRECDDNEETGENPTTTTTVGNSRKPVTLETLRFDKVLETCFSATGSSRFSEAWNLRSLGFANV